jgi:recombinational DNA repair protein RecR
MRKTRKDFIQNIDINRLEEFVVRNSVSEVVIASQKTDG